MTLSVVGIGYRVSDLLPGARDVVALLAGALAGVLLLRGPAAVVQRCPLGARVSAVLLAVLNA